MDAGHEKRADIDTIENVSSSSNDSLPTGDADDKIIYDLQHHGEEIGMTFRTIMAACVKHTASLVHAISDLV